ncbi:MAG: hypothetical protein LQ340_007780, partial [Diploschistes diacapsis]
MSPSPPVHPSRPIPQTNNALYLPTTAAYDRWAATYDTDSNPLQALDDLQLRRLLPRFVDLVHGEHKPPGSSAQPTDSSDHPHVIDLGCGTGRNTLALLALLGRGSRVTGLDASAKMLAIARERC